ncbi:HTH-type transcriptional regulator ArgP [Azohydromonas caseinilytica]|uniref:HTH-type transcriptional regulator ArgP n=1 Tax=Azohydromonas caseinilytica TaxID=2728836 RepID=A0A848F9K7_9BURK|nr:HTH-type transcriptional regulator ArgP [Azohydromonas caseinilytica]NML15938.1 HTH-type transcriptional regulator ArgP [Azohydromonas caseinilytica]
MFDRQQLHTLATIVEEGSFERAAAVMNLTRGAISQRIKLLEESVSAILLVRQKPVVPTPAGEILLRHVKALRLLEESTLRQLEPAPGTSGRLPLTIAVNADSLATWFARVLWTPLVQSRVALEVIAEDQAHTLERLARGDVIGCVSSLERAPAGFVADALGAMEYRCMASRALAERFFPDGLTLKAVLEAPAVLFNRRDGLHNEFLAGRFGMRIERYPRHYLPAPGALLEAVHSGCGYGLVPALQLQADPARHDLVDLAPKHPVPVALYWHHWQVEPPLSQELSATVRAVAKAMLQPLPGERPAPSAAEARSWPVRDEAESGNADGSGAALVRAA